MEDTPDTAYNSAREQENYMLEKAAMVGGLPSNYRQPPVRKVLEVQIAELEKQIAVRRDLLTKLDANQGVEEVLDALRKVGI